MIPPTHEVSETMRTREISGSAIPIISATIDKFDRFFLKAIIPKISPTIPMGSPINGPISMLNGNPNRKLSKNPMTVTIIVMIANVFMLFLFILYTYLWL